MNKIIVGFIGASGSGKDTASDYLVNNYGFKKMSFADPLKKMVKECFLLSDNQCYGSEKEEVDERWGCSPREMFQVIGTEFGQYMLPELLPSLKDKIAPKCFWVSLLLEHIKKVDTRCIVIADVRFKHEIDALLNEGAYLFRIERNVDKQTRDHISEQEWKIIDHDKIFPINNNGTLQDLYNKIDNYFLLFSVEFFIHFNMIN